MLIAQAMPCFEVQAMTEPMKEPNYLSLLPVLQTGFLAAVTWKPHRRPFSRATINPELIKH